MPCYFPLQGYRSLQKNVSGKRSIVFNRNQGFVDMPVSCPCGQCIGCRLERSRQWAIRCVHEASLYEKNCFITLTYNDANLPKDGSLNVRHFQLFMKRLRKKFGSGIRFFHCGEYGSRFGRPHYHAILFNFDFSDRVFFKNSNGLPLDRSSDLESLWPYGYSTVGDCTFESAAYVARYLLKKVTGENAFYHYSDIDYDSGEILSTRKPEYTTMSRKPGIAKAWFDKYGSDVHPRDEVIIRQMKMRPPRYYDSLFEVSDPDGMEMVRARRRRLAAANDDNDSLRMEVKEYIKKRQVERLVRNLDSGDFNDS